MAHKLQLSVKNLVKTITSLLLIWVITWSGYAQSTLLPGDLLTVSLNGSNSTLEIVPLIDLEENTQFSIKSSSNPDSELIITVKNKIEAGSSLHISGNSSTQFDVAGTLRLNPISEQITLVQIDQEYSRILFTAGWGTQSNGVSELSINNSIPNIYFGEGSNHQYYLKNGASGTVSMIKRMVTEPSNWKTSEKPFSRLRTSFRILAAPVIVFNQNISTVIEGDSIPLNVAIYEHDGSRLTVDVVMNEDFSTADTNDILSFRKYTYNFTGLIGDAVYEIKIPQNDDSFFEDRETVFFELRNLSSGYFGDFVSHATFIIDNEIPNVTLSTLFDAEGTNQDYIELQNNERVYVSIEGWLLKCGEIEYKLGDIEELNPLETRKLFASDFIVPEEDGIKSFELCSNTAFIIDGFGNLISELNLNIEQPIELEISKNDRKVDTPLEFESTQSIVQIQSAEISQKSVAQQLEKKSLEGWLPIQHAEFDDAIVSIYWNEQSSTYEEVTIAVLDSLNGHALLSYFLPNNDELNMESFFVDTALSQIETEFNNEWSITLSATDLDGNGIINGTEGYNFVQYVGSDSISVSTLIKAIETKIGDNFLYPYVFTLSEKSNYSPLKNQELVYSGEFLWIKADSAFSRVELAFESTLLFNEPDVPIEIDEPISNFKIIVQSDSSSSALGINLYGIEDNVPSSIINPALDLRFNLFEIETPVIGVFAHSNWQSEINLAYQQETILKYPLGISSLVPGELSVVLEEWNMEGGWRLFIEDSETNERHELHPGGEFKFEFHLNKIENDDQDELQQRVSGYDINERYTLLLVSPEYVESNIETPEQIQLNQNYPNPFNPATTISFFIPESVEIKLSVFNVVGQPITVLEDGTLNAGEHHFEWNASGYPSGMYIYQLEVGNKVMTRKMTLVK